MFTVQIYRTEGRDEDFEAETADEAMQIARDEWADRAVRRISVLNDAEWIVEEWSR